VRLALEHAVGVGEGGPVLEPELDGIVPREDAAHLTRFRMAVADPSPASVDALGQFGIGLKHRAARPDCSLVRIRVVSA
jgi:hypothetical protein